MFMKDLTEITEWLEAEVNGIFTWEIIINVFFFVLSLIKRRSDDSGINYIELR